jgi:hypothetical protein
MNPGIHRRSGRDGCPDSRPVSPLNCRIHQARPAARRDELPNPSPARGWPTGSFNATGVANSAAPLCNAYPKTVRRYALAQHRAVAGRDPVADRPAAHPRCAIPWRISNQDRRRQGRLSG